MKRLLHVLVLVAGLLTIGVAPAVAAAPSNDELGAATSIPSVPFSETIDTTEATPGVGDELNTCFEQGTTVWYAHTAQETGWLAATTEGSSYDTVLTVFVDDGSGLAELACNDDAIGMESRVTFEADAGTTYYFLVGSFAGGPGGSLTFNLVQSDPPPPPLEVTLAIASSASVRPSRGTATVRGTITCNQAADGVVYGNLRQRAGRLIINAPFSSTVSCSSEPTTWIAFVPADAGRLAGGRGTVSASVDVWNDFSAASDSATRTIRLRGR